MIISVLLLIALNNYIKVDKHYRRSYYVNNSFYNNIYDNNAQNKYELLCREVGEWEHFENFNNLKKFLILLLTFLFFRFIYSSNVIYINALSSCVKSKFCAKRNRSKNIDHRFRSYTSIIKDFRH